jgi:hypothetical protein
MEAVVVVLQAVEKFDEQIATARRGAEETANLGKGLRLDLAAARKISAASSALAGMNAALRLLPRLGHR